MKHRKLLSYWSGILVLLILGAYCTHGAYAQVAVTTATLTGTVTDPNGSVVPQARVTLTSVEIGVARTYTTTGQGFYSFTQLPPSTYQLEVQAGGFSSYLERGISLDAGQSASLNVKLTIGNVTQQVVVTSQAPLINTTNANIAAEVDSKQIVELPLNDRNVYSLIQLNSSVQTGNLYQTVLGGNGNSDNADQDVTFLNFAGGYFGTSAYLLDGTWDTALNSWGGVISVPSVDDTQEFKIQTNTFTAQYGWSSGNVVDVTTKSGTNAYHGDAYAFYRASATDANLWFSDYTGLPKESFSRNQDGGSFGGPLQIPGVYKQRDKTYFFGLFEHLNLNSPTANFFTVPDANMRSGSFSELLGAQVGTDALGRPIYSGQIYDPRSGRAITAGQVDPKTGLTATETGYIRDPITDNNLNNIGNELDTLGAKAISYYPTPTGTGLVNNLVLNGNSPAASDEYSIRVDQNIGQATRFFTRYTYKHEYKTGESTFYGASDPANLGEIVGDNRWDVVSGYSHAFSQNLTMDIHAGVRLWHEHNGMVGLGFLPSTIGFPAYLDTARQFPYMQLANESQLGQQGDALYQHGPTVSLAVDFIKQAGAHTTSFGFMGVNLMAGTIGQYTNSINIEGHFTCGPDPTLCTANTGNAVAQTLLGLPDSGDTGVASNPETTFHYYGGYVQDDWRAFRKLTLNLGLRYDIQGAPTVHHNLGASFNTDIVNPIGTEIGGKMGVLMGALQFLTPNNRGVYDTVYTNWSPRIGFNYQLLPTLVVRSGYGIFFTPSVNGANQNSDGYGATTPIVSSTNAGVNPVAGLSLENPWPQGYVVPSGNTLGPLQDVGFSTGGIFRYHPSGYVQEYLFGLQDAITKSDSLEVDYFGNHGVRMITASLSHSQLNPSYLSMGALALNAQVPNPFYGYIRPGQSGCGMDQPTIVQSQLLQPYPQYCSVGENVAPVGFSLYNALEATYNHRFHNGLSVLVSYTFSKFLDNVEGAQNWAVGGNSSPANNYDLAAEKSVDASNTPQSLVASYIYQLPIGTGRAIGSGFNRKTDAVLGGWELSGIVTSRSGPPVSVSGNNWNSYGGNPRPDVTGNVHVSHRSINEWFNTGAFAYAPYGDFGNAPRYFSSISSPDYNNFDTAIMKNWQLGESRRIQFRLETFNTFNHPNFFTPNGSYSGCDPNSNPNCVSGFGQITKAFPSREVQWSGKFYW
jgi:hypothetical protein